MNIPYRSNILPKVDTQPSPNITLLSEHLRKLTPIEASSRVTDEYVVSTLLVTWRTDNVSEEA